MQITIGSIVVGVLIANVSSSVVGMCEYEMFIFISIATPELLLLIYICSCTHIILLYCLE